MIRTLNFLAVLMAACGAAAAFADDEPAKKDKPDASGLPSIAQIFEKLDANGDGKLTKEEVPEQAIRLLGSADADGDGSITKEELESQRKKLGQRNEAGGGAGPGGPRGLPSAAEMLSRLDKNNDGKLSKDELPEQFAEQMLRGDSDGDGSLTKDEIEAHRKKLTASGFAAGAPSPDQLFARQDKNNDGKLTKDELPEGLAERLIKADADGDGAITKAELEAVRKQFGGPGGTGTGSLPNVEETFSRLDKNNDGKLSKDEIPEPMIERMSRADGDGDGEVTKEELTAAMKKMLQVGAGAGRPGLFDPSQIFAKLDRNVDGKLSKDEIPEQMAERLLKADKDGDGSISKDEIEGARQQFEGGPRGANRPQGEGKPKRDGRPKRDE